MKPSTRHIILPRVECNYCPLFDLIRGCQAYKSPKLIDCFQVTKEHVQKRAKLKICGNCKWHKYEEFTKDYICVNSDSEFCADWTEYNDICEEWEER